MEVLAAYVPLPALSMGLVLPTATAAVGIGMSRGPFEPWKTPGGGGRGWWATPPESNQEGVYPPLPLPPSSFFVSGDSNFDH